MVPNDPIKHTTIMLSMHRKQRLALAATNATKCLARRTRRSTCRSNRFHVGELKGCPLLRRLHSRRNQDKDHGCSTILVLGREAKTTFIGDSFHANPPQVSTNTPRVIEQETTTTTDGFDASSPINGTATSHMSFGTEVHKLDKTSLPCFLRCTQDKIIVPPETTNFAVSSGTTSGSLGRPVHSSPKQESDAEKSPSLDPCLETISSTSEDGNANVLFDSEWSDKQDRVLVAEETSTSL